MKRYFRQIAATALAAALVAAPIQASAWQKNEQMIRVGLASSSSHNAKKEMECAHLQNSDGYGAGFQFGYYDADLKFHPLAWTSEAVTAIAMLKTQNLYYGYSSSQGKHTYVTDPISNIAVGCYHVRLPGAYAVYEDAAADAELYEGGFVAWIDGEYQVRIGSYVSREGAEGAVAALGQGEIVGTSAYGINVVKTGTSNILFQFDVGTGGKLAVLPDVTGASDVQTWFSGFKYRGGFTYQRMGGGNLTVVNILSLENYIKGVAPFEMGNSWPLEALKTQATCARTYAMGRLGYHNALGFDVCNSDNCQVYYGVGSNREDYGPTAVSDQAVEETAGMLVWYKNELAETYYSSSHGGASESVELVWGSDLDKYPYLCGVSDPYEATIAHLNDYSSWTVRYTKAELLQRLQNRGYGIGTSIDHLVLTYSELGNVIRVDVYWANGEKNTFKPDNIRGTFGVKSIRFVVNGMEAEPAALPDEKVGEPVKAFVEEKTAQRGEEDSSKSVREGEADEAVTEEVYINEKDAWNEWDGMYAILEDGTKKRIQEAPYLITGTGELYQWQTEGSEEEERPEAPEIPKEPEEPEEPGEILPPTASSVTVSGDSYVFQGSGWGHQLGMSQFGANAMARLGFTYEEIITFYFPGTHIADLSNHLS